MGSRESFTMRNFIDCNVHLNEIKKNKSGHLASMDDNRGASKFVKSELLGMRNAERLGIDSRPYLYIL